MKNKEIILIVDDEEPIRKLLRSRFEREGYQVFTAENPKNAVQTLKDNGITPHVVVSDLKMPEHDGFWLLNYIRNHYENTRFILATGFGEKEVAVQALREGATDYLEKPFDLDELSLGIKRCISEVNLRLENNELLERLKARAERAEKQVKGETGWIPSQAKSMNDVEKWMSTLKRESLSSKADDPTVLILGESGTGKERVAARIHAESRVASGPFLAVNCANFTSEMLESELFGHEKGSFTGAVAQKRGLFELAQNGTLFLDEIGEMDLKLQPRLLRVLQEKIFRRLGGSSDLDAKVRIIAATNRDIGRMVRDGSFREDLYHRINRVEITLPPLRSRSEDLIPLAETFGKRAYQNRGKKWFGFSTEAQGLILQYNWPGNLREMINVIERAALLDEGQGPIPGTLISVKPSHLPDVKPQADFEPTLLLEREERDRSCGFTEMKRKWSLAFEREYLQSLLNHHAGNISAAAREAKLDRSNMMKLLKKHGLVKKNMPLAS